MMKIETITQFIKPGFFNEGDEEIAGTRTKLASLTENETEALINILDRMYYKNSYTMVKDLIVDNYDLILNLVRSVKTNTKQDFKGVFAKGNELTIKPLEPEDFDFLWGTDTNKTFEKDVIEGQVYDYIGTSASPESTPEESGIIILGFMEETPDGKIGNVQLKKNGDIFPQQKLEWDTVAEENILSLPEPYVILPESSFQIKAKADITGKTILRPIGFKVLQAKTIPSLFQ